MERKYILYLLFALIIICVFTFTVIYLADEETDHTFQEAFYTSVQIQTSIGMSNASDRKSLRNWITAQSILSYILNILLVIYLSMTLAKI
jgi:predicted membrane protein